MPDVMIAQYGEKILYLGQEKRHAIKALMDELKLHSEDRHEIVGYSSLGIKSDAEFDEEQFPVIFQEKGFIMGVDRHMNPDSITHFSVLPHVVKDWKNESWTEYTELPIKEESDGK